MFRLNFLRDFCEFWKWSVRLKMKYLPNLESHTQLSGQVSEVAHFCILFCSKNGERWSVDLFLRLGMSFQLYCIIV